MPHQPPVRRASRRTTATARADRATGAPISLDTAHAVFHRWLGEDYDTDALDAVLAAAAVEKLDDGSDPVWLLIISGPATAKTETVQALDGVGAVVTSAITGEAALLSATPKRERTKDATGGLLRKIGDRGLLVVKDVTSILSMNNDARAKVLAALREIYDGRWYREVGSDGGHTLEWKGRLVVVGAVTTAWDTAPRRRRHHGRPVHPRPHRLHQGQEGVRAPGHRATPATRCRCAASCPRRWPGVIAGMNTVPITVTDDETERLLAAADLVTLARTGVEYDYRGDVIDAHAPEMPTRFAKQLTQIVRGAVAIGMDRADALRLAMRCARDSMPPLRLAIIDDLAAYPDSTPTEVRKRLGKPRATVDRQLQALHILGVLTLVEETNSSKASRGSTHSPTASTPVPLSSHQKRYQKSHHTPLAPMKRVKEARARTERERTRQGYVLTFLVTGRPAPAHPHHLPAAPRRPTVARPTSRGSARPVTSSRTGLEAP